MRYVISETGLDSFIRVIETEGNVQAEIFCDFMELPLLRVALERTINEIDDMVGEDSFIGKAVTRAVEEYHLQHKREQEQNRPRPKRKGTS